MSHQTVVPAKAETNKPSAGRPWNSSGFFIAAFFILLASLMACATGHPSVRRAIKGYGTLAAAASVLAAILIFFRAGCLSFLRRHRSMLTPDQTGRLFRLTGAPHIYLALLAMGFTLPHVYLSLSRNSTLTHHNLTGFLALAALLMVCLSGFFPKHLHMRKLHTSGALLFLAALFMHM